MPFACLLGVDGLQLRLGGLDGQVDQDGIGLAVGDAELDQLALHPRLGHLCHKDMDLRPEAVPEFQGRLGGVALPGLDGLQLRQGPDAGRLQIPAIGSGVRGRIVVLFEPLVQLVETPGGHGEHGILVFVRLYPGEGIPEHWGLLVPGDALDRRVELLVRAARDLPDDLHLLVQLVGPEGDVINLQEGSRVDAFSLRLGRGHGDQLHGEVAHKPLRLRYLRCSRDSLHGILLRKHRDTARCRENPRRMRGLIQGQGFSLTLSLHCVFGVTYPKPESQIFGSP